MTSIFDHPDIFVYTSDRRDGSMKNNGVFDEVSIEGYLASKHITKPLVVMNQVHGTSVAFVDEHRQSPIASTDGLITDRDVVLGVVTADCLPITFYDPVKKIIGAVHAGYRGMYDGIVGKTLDAFTSRGSQQTSLLVGVGPSIGVCCYSVDATRAEDFRERFGREFIEVRNDKMYLNLKKIAQSEFLTHGIPIDNITVQNACTQCMNDIYYSYRADSRETFGEMITVIGII